MGSLWRDDSMYGTPLRSAVEWIDFGHVQVVEAVMIQVSVPKRLA